MLYEYRHRGVLTYSETMPRPLAFLAPYIGEGLARNPLALGDPSAGDASAPRPSRGALKPAGKAMGLLAPIFLAENKLQARVLGVDATAIASARAEIERVIRSQ